MQVFFTAETLVAFINFLITFNDRISSVSEVSESVIYGSTLLIYLLIVRISRNASPRQNTTFSVFNLGS